MSYAADPRSKCRYCKSPAKHKIQGVNVCEHQRCKYMAWTEEQPPPKK